MPVFFSIQSKFPIEFCNISQRRVHALYVHPAALLYQKREKNVLKVAEKVVCILKQKLAAWNKTFTVSTSFYAASKMCVDKEQMRQFSDCLICVKFLQWHLLTKS